MNATLTAEILNNLTTECLFPETFDDIEPVENVVQSYPRRKIMHFRADHDGYRWWNTVWPHHDELATKGMKHEIDATYDALTAKDALADLPTLARVCLSHMDACAGENSTDEFNFYLRGELCDYWVRLITRKGDYNMYYEISNETKFYFSYRAMVEYYRLCRIHSSKHGLKLRNDPYMKEALRFVQGMFDFGYNGGYSVHLQTKINHEWASGLVIHLDNNYFTAEFELAEALLEIGAWYEESCRRLREELLQERAIRLPALPPHNAEGGKREQ